MEHSWPRQWQLRVSTVQRCFHIRYVSCIWIQFNRSMVRIPSKQDQIQVNILTIIRDVWIYFCINLFERRFLPRFDKLCSAELLSQKLLVPCEPEAYLEKEYGSKRWRTPLAKNYQWDNVKYWTNWTENEWIHTVRYYDRHGKLIKNKTREHLNKFLSFNLSSSEFDRLLQYE